MMPYKNSQVQSALDNSIMMAMDSMTMACHPRRLVTERKNKSMTVKWERSPISKKRSRFLSDPDRNPLDQYSCHRQPPLVRVATATHRPISPNME